VTADGARLGRAAAQWARTHRAHAGGWAIRYRTAGEGPPIVLVHGLGCSADYWMKNGPWLAASGHRVIAMDLPGFGRTAGPRCLSIIQQAFAVSALVETLKLGPAVYVGHSLSCQTVLELAATEPARVAGLVLAAPTGDRRRKRLLYEAIGFMLDIPREPPSLVPVIAEAYLRAGPVRWMRTWVGGKRHDTFGAAARVRAPALVLVGEDDPVSSPKFGAALARAIPGGRMRVVPQAAHAIIFDEPAGFNDAVLGFAREIGPAPAPE
jgi:pimeloyl-ACP methyl ester carboxylesterase